MSFYEQHQQAAPVQSNNSDNNRVTPTSLDGSSYARGNQQQPTFAPYEPQRSSISFTPHQQPSPGQEKTLDALQPDAPRPPAPRPLCSRPLGPSAAATTATTAATAATAATTAATATAATATSTAATAAPAYCATMALLRVLAFDHEGRPVQFDTWLDDLQLYLLSDSKDSVSLFDLASGAAIAPPATADSATRSQWLTHDVAACLAIRNHLPLAECAHFGQHRAAQALYDAVVARYSLPATAALGRLLLPYLFPELSDFATLVDLVSHLRISDARYRATVPAEDHFLSLDPTSLTVDLLEQHLLVAETSAVAVGAARGTPRQPLFEGCSPSPLAPSYASAAATDVPIAEDAGAAFASAKRRSSKGKGGKGGGVGSGGGGGSSGSGGGGRSGGRGGSGGGGGDGTGGGSGGFGGGGGGSGGSGGSGGGGSGGGRTGPRRGGSGGGQRQQQLRRSETQSPQQHREWLFQRGTSRGSDSCPYVIRTGDRAGQTCKRFHTQHRCFSRLDDAWRAEFGDEVECPRWADLLRTGVAIFDLDFDAILSAMHALSASSEGDCYRCVPPDPGIAAAALVASDSGTLPGTAPAEALHTFTLNSGASRCFFRDSTTRNPLLHLSRVPQVDPLPGTALVEVVVGSGAARGAASGGAASGGAELGGAESEGAGSGGAEPGGAELAGVEPMGVEPEGVEPGGAESEGAESGGAQPRGAASIGGSTGASPRQSPQQLCEWLVQRARLRTRAIGAGASPLPAPSPYTEQSGGLTECREPASCPISPVRTACRVPCLRPPPVPGTHVWQSVPDPESDRARAASPTVARLLATAVTDPSFESAAASALVVELLEFAAACRLDYATAVVAASKSASPPSVEGECALGTDVLEDRQEDFDCLAVAVPRFASMLLAPKGDPDAPDIPTPRSYAKAIMGPYSSQWQAAMDAELASWKSTGTYVYEVPPPGANIVDGMWIFKGSLHEEIWLRRPPGFTGSFPAGTQWSLRRQVYRLRQAPFEWHDTLRTTLAALGFAPSTADPSLFLCTDTSLPLFYVLVYIDDLIFATADTEALTLVKSEL
ncbi:unnamed protein product [Closterium sp. NIES-53]